MKPKTSLLKSVVLIYVLMCIVLFVKDVFAEKTQRLRTKSEINITLLNPASAEETSESNR